MIYELSNEHISINVNKHGAQLCKLDATQSKTEFLWNAKPEVWAKHAPVLFPIVGGLKNNTYFLGGKRYELPRHGFAQRRAFDLVSQTNNELVLKLTSNPATLAQYPFNFALFLTFRLERNTLHISHLVKNTGDTDLLFSLGAHPAFKCPVLREHGYSDYSIRFKEKETVHILSLKEGLIDGQEPFLNNQNTIKLNKSLFANDALVFDSLKSRTVWLESSDEKIRIRMDYPGFDYYGIWAKDGADFVCLEPWQGIADATNVSGVLSEKRGIINLKPSKSHTASYSVTIEQGL